MTNPISVVKPEILMENKMTIHRFLKQSYYGAKRQLEGGITCIQDGISFFRDEFSGLHKKAVNQFHRMAMPVNNFLKDPVQLESELRVETNQQDEYPPTGTIVPVDMAMQSPLEENY